VESAAAAPTPQQRKQKAMNLLIQSGLVASDVCSSPAGRRPASDAGQMLQG